MASSSRRIKLSSSLRPFVSRVVRNGRVQRAFAEQIGRPVGGCVSQRTKGQRGMSGAEIHRIAKDCASGVRGTRLALAAPAARGRLAAQMEVE